MKKTAVEWLCDELEKFFGDDDFGVPISLYEQAEQMDFENIKQAYNDGKRDAYRQDDVPTADEYVYQKYGHEKL